MAITLPRAWLLRGAALLTSLAFAMALGETVLRIVFRDHGRATMGAPGGEPFEYEYLDQAADARWPQAQGAKSPGVRRLLVLGDSITYGVGVREWQAVWPNRLLERLVARGARCDMHVVAAPGRNTDQHAAAAAELVPRLDPDYVVYQWYVNDLEVRQPRPAFRRTWHEWSYHRWLQTHSFLYFVVDDRLSKMLPPGSRAYVDFLRTTFRPGAAPWARFRHELHVLAAHATSRARRTLVLLYPQVPFRGPYPLEDIHARIRAIADTSELDYPAVMFTGEAGENVPDPWPPAGSVRQSRGVPGTLAQGPELPLAAGRYVLKTRMRLDAISTGHVATITVRSRAGTMAERHLYADQFGRPGSWTTFDVPFGVDGPGLELITWEVSVTEAVRLSVESFGIAVRYERLDVVDLKDRLNRGDTHVSVFDAHPNARAHDEIAAAVAEWVGAVEQGGVAR
jgi:lysophospholipase L1-like esterase